MKSSHRLQARFPALILAALVVSAAAVRIGTAARIPCVETDAAFYGRLAQEMIRGEAADSGPPGFHPAWPSFYPWLTATFAMLTGTPDALDAAGPADPRRVERAARLVNVLLGSLLLLPVFHLGRRVGGTAGGLLAAFLTAFHPRLVFFSAQALTEAGFTFFTVTSLALLPDRERTRFAWFRIAAAAAAAGLAALTRPEGVLLLLTGAAALLAFGFGGAGRRIAAAAVYILVVLLVITPRILEMKASGAGGGPIPLPGLSAKADYNLAQAYRGAPGVPAAETSLSEYNNLPGGRPIPRFDFADFAFRHPGVVIRHAGREIGRALAAVFSLAYWMFALPAVFGLWSRRRRLTRAEGAWLLTWLSFAGLYALVFVYRRFFAAFLPLLLIECAAGLLAIGTALARRGDPERGESRSVPVAGLLALLLIAPGGWLVHGQIRSEGYAPEQKELGLAVAAGRSGAPPGMTRERPAIAARKPVAAFYASAPIRAFPRVEPDSLAPALRDRGISVVVIDERDLVRERPAYRPWLEDPPAGFSVSGRFGATPDRCVLLVRNAPEEP